LTLTVTGSVAPWVNPQVEPRSRTTIKNAKGLNTSITDSLYPTKATTYQYDAAGNATQVTDPLGNATTLAYDTRGRKTGMADPDMGAWSYAYNSVGELKSQTDAKNQTQALDYDALGRMTRRTTLEGTSTWTYDTAPGGANGLARGQLAAVSGPNGYQETYTYDTLARPSTATITVDAVPYTTTTTYDSVSRVETLTYPQTNFTARHVYNAHGLLASIQF